MNVLTGPAPKMRQWGDVHYAIGNTVENVWSVLSSPKFVQYIFIYFKQAKPMCLTMRSRVYMTGCWRPFLLFFCSWVSELVCICVPREGWHFFLRWLLCGWGSPERASFTQSCPIWNPSSSGEELRSSGAPTPPRPLRKLFEFNLLLSVSWREARLSTLTPP